MGLSATPFGVLPNSIPPFSTSGVLPPFRGPGSSVTDPATMSPYKTNMDSLVDRFATSTDRKSILSGLLSFRSHLRGLGIYGFQWLDGSFCEDVEATEGRSPRDIDVVTFFYRPAAATASSEWQQFCMAHPQTFDVPHLKGLYQTDAYFVDLSLPAPDIVSSTRYWFGLFSHKRAIGLWKGMVQVTLDHNDDSAALALLAGK